MEDEHAVAGLEEYLMQWLNGYKKCGIDNYYTQYSLLIGWLAEVGLHKLKRFELAFMDAI